MERYLRIEGVEMRFDTKKGPFTALSDITLDVVQGEFVSLIGHSGCGKSTLLNLIAGLTKPTKGTLLLANREIAGPGPDRGVVFQNHSLLPWLTCFDNVHLAVERVFGGTEKKLRLAERVHTGTRAGAPRSCIPQVSARNLRRHEATSRHRARPCHGAKDTPAR